MAGSTNGFPGAANQLGGFETPIAEQELERRIGKGPAWPYLFIPVLEGGDEGRQKISRIRKVREYAQNGLGGIYVVQFALLDPGSEEVQKTSNAYFMDGRYQGEVDEDAPLHLREGGSEPKVTSGYFINRSRGDNLLIGAKERLDRQESVI